MQRKANVCTHSKGTLFHPHRDTDPEQQAGTNSTQLARMLLPGPRNLLCFNWEKTLLHSPPPLPCHSLPLNKQVTSTSSRTHRVRCRSQKWREQLMWHETICCKLMHIMHLMPDPCTHNCVRCISWRGTTSFYSTLKSCCSSRWGCALQMFLAPSVISSVIKSISTCSQQAHPWPWLKV